MAVFTTNVATDFSVPGSFFVAGPSSVLEATSSLVRLVTPTGYYQDYVGSFSYTYSGGYKYLSWPDSTLNALYSYDSSWNVMGSVTGMAIPGSTYLYYANNNDFEGLKAYAFQGNDTFNGSSSGDVIWGYAGNDVLYGNGGSDTLKGDAGNDTLNGGVGSDTMLGGAGNDTYYVDNAGDRVFETTTVTSGINAGGTDKVISAVSFNLSTNSAGSIYIENLTLTGPAASGTGNALANTLIGNGAANILDGKTGADTMLGGAGNDTYYVDNIGDRVFETTTTTSGIDAGGADTVYSYLTSYTLGNFVENGRVMSTGAANLTGNSLSNTIYAGKGDNVLAGGSGTDTLSYAYGANGTTGVKVSLATTAAQATGGSGNDTVSGFERLTGSANNDSLTGNSGANILRGGNGNDTLTGGSGADTLYGDAGNDLLRGGTGNDILYGGTGLDVFRFDSLLGTSTTPNIDQIKDFVVADDTIQLENSIFNNTALSAIAANTALSSTTTLAGYFRANSTGLAQDANDYIIYETDTGNLFYDSNGSASGGSVQIALLGTNLALTAADFVII